MSSLIAASRLPKAVKREVELDRAGVPAADPGSAQVIEAAIQWLCRAHDRSASPDGGVGRSCSLAGDWASSYPETRGYIVPTFLDYASSRGREDIRARARRMLEWLASIQLPSGAFQGGTIGARPATPVHFNTGQIEVGLAAGEKALGGYRQPMWRAADWLVQTQDPDGCWHKFPSPSGAERENTYYTRVAWWLLEAARVDPDRGYGEAALANVRWTLTQQRTNGWFDECCLTDASQPLTHTLDYALRGVREGYMFGREPDLFQAARRTADGLLSAVRPDGALPGLPTADWSSAADWVCLTGVAQIAYFWLVLYQETGEARYSDAALAASQYVRSTVHLEGPEDSRSEVKGSFPVGGDCGGYEFLNCAAKFVVDALVLERTVGADMAPNAIMSGRACQIWKSRDWRDQITCRPVPQRLVVEVAPRPASRAANRNGKR